MKVFVTGATGALGRLAVPLLVGAGHEVHAVARDAAKADRLARSGATPVTVELADAASVRAAVARVRPAAIAHLATHIPPANAAVVPGAWRQNDRLRRDTSRYLLDAALEYDVARYVQESITFGYLDGGDRWLDEDAPVAHGPQEKATAASAAQVARMAAAGRVGVLLRIGWMYGPDDGFSRYIVDRARAGKAAIPGPRGAYVSPVHVADAAGAVLAALDAPGGVYNVVDDAPLRREELARAVAEATGAPRTGGLLPASLLRLSGRSRPLTRSQRVSNRRLRAATSWRPAFASAADGWKAVVAEMEPA